MAYFRKDLGDDYLALKSTLIDEERFVHGFPERHGGVSTGKRTSLNLGFRWGDEQALVEDNRRIVAQREGYDAEALVVTKHVHGTAVWTVGDQLPNPPEFDGLACDHAGPVLGAFAADCIPLVFADPVVGICGACHAGWRGTVNGMAVRVLEAMTALGSKPDNIRIALGQSIGPCCFEVGDEVVEEFETAFPGTVGLVVQGPKKHHINLRVATRVQLEAAGIAPEHLDDHPPCTKCNPERFFSYRREGLEGGVHMGFIGLR